MKEIEDLDCLTDVEPGQLRGFHDFTYMMSLLKTIDNGRSDYMRECCGNCKYNKRDFSKPQNRGYAEFCCGNENSEFYGVPTSYDDSCDDYEEKE